MSDKNTYFCQANSSKYFQNPFFLLRVRRKSGLGVEIRCMSKEGLIEMGISAGRKNDSDSLEESKCF